MGHGGLGCPVPVEYGSETLALGELAVLCRRRLLLVQITGLWVL